jgi:hypothetical protein
MDGFFRASKLAELYKWLASSADVFMLLLLALEHTFTEDTRSSCADLACFALIAGQAQHAAVQLIGCEIGRKTCCFD